MPYRGFIRLGALNESPERESGTLGEVRRKQGLRLPFGWGYSHQDLCLVCCVVVCCIVSTEKQNLLWELPSMELIQTL